LSCAAFKGLYPGFHSIEACGGFRTVAGSHAFKASNRGIDRYLPKADERNKLVRKN
jgi:hypothetical protein